MPNFGKFELGHFTPTPEEEKRNPDIRKKMEAANEALRRRAAEQAKKKLGESFEDEEEREGEKEVIKEVA